MGQFPEAKFPEALFRAFDQRMLELIMLPTEQCNFRCTYCYEKFEIGKMKEPVRLAIKRHIEKRSKELNHLRLGWFGGEPTLAIDVIEDISKYAAECSRSNGFGLSGSITTNGYLLDRFLSRLMHCGVREYQVSLDGPQECHDRTRLRADGRGTFDRVWSNLKMMRDSSFEFHVILRLHMTPANVDSLYDFVPSIDREFLGDRRFSLLFAPVEHLGGENDETFATLNHADQVRHIEALRSMISSVPVEQEPNEFDGDMPYVCYASKANAYVIRASGDVCKCTVALEDPSNLIGHLTPDGNMVLDRSKYLPWLKGWETKGMSTLHCPLAEMRLCEGCH